MDNIDSSGFKILEILIASFLIYEKDRNSIF